MKIWIKLIIIERKLSSAVTEYWLTLLSRRERNKRRFAAKTPLSSGAVCARTSLNTHAKTIRWHMWRRGHTSAIHALLNNKQHCCLLTPSIYILRDVHCVPASQGVTPTDSRIIDDNFRWYYHSLWCVLFREIRVKSRRLLLFEFSPISTRGWHLTFCFVVVTRIVTL